MDTRVHAGDLQPPNGEDESLSANPEKGRLPNVSSCTLVSAFESCRKRLEESFGIRLEASTVESAEKQWLLAQLTANGAEKPRAKLSTKGVWECRDGNQRLGYISHADVLLQDAGAVAKLFSLRSVVRFRLRPTDVQHKILWAAARCIPWASREVTLGHLRNEFGTANPASWSYHKVCDAAKRWAELQAKRKDGGAIEAQLVWNTGNVLGQAAKETMDRLADWKSRNHQETSPPWPKAAGFTVKADGVRLEKLGTRTIRGKKHDRLFLRLAIFGMKDGHKQAQPLFLAEPQGKNIGAKLARTLSGEYTSKTCRVVWDDDNRCWMANLSIQWPKPAKVDGETMFVRRGMGRFLTAVTATGEFPTPFSTGEQLANIHAQCQDRECRERGILDVKRELDAQKRDARRDLLHQGKGSRGHGIARFYRRYHKAAHHERNYVKTWCQQQAAHLVKECLRLGCGKVIVEDFSNSTCPVHFDKRLQTVLRRFPFFQLQTAIEWACAKAGLDYKAQSVNYDPKCPRCSEMLGDDGHYKVCACGFAADRDTLALYRLARAADVPAPGLEAAIGAQEQLSKAIPAIRRKKHVVRRKNVG